ncbi:MAG TPA: hypothetical protein VFD45_01420 [Patescibacteria group bacterium]|nr:hypothetical protein [Patescibacteria group bacterium]
MSVEKKITKTPTKDSIDTTRKLFEKGPFFDNLGQHRGAGAIERGKELFRTYKLTPRTNAK